MRRHCRYVLAHVSSSVMSYGNALVCVRSSHHVYALFLRPGSLHVTCKHNLVPGVHSGILVFPRRFCGYHFSPCTPCRPPIRVAMGYLNRRLAAPRKREGRWVVVRTCASPAETDPGGLGASKEMLDPETRVGLGGCYAHPTHCRRQ